jgi:hypothetical protein
MQPVIDRRCNQARDDSKKSEPGPGHHAIAASCGLPLADSRQATSSTAAVSQARPNKTMPTMLRGCPSSTSPAATKASPPGITASTRRPKTMLVVSACSTSRALNTVSSPGITTRAAATASKCLPPSPVTREASSHSSVRMTAMHVDDTAADRTTSDDSGRMLMNAFPLLQGAPDVYRSAARSVRFPRCAECFRLSPSESTVTSWARRI